MNRTKDQSETFKSLFIIIIIAQFLFFAVVGIQYNMQGSPDEAKWSDSNVLG